MQSIALLFGFMAYIAFSMVWSGYVLHIIWAWFAVPLFSLPALSIPAAIGVSITTHYLTHSYTPKYKDHKPDTADAVLDTVLRPLIILCLAWLVKQWL